MGALTDILARFGIGQPKIQPKQAPSAGQGIFEMKKAKARQKKAEEISADSKDGNPLHYQTHVNDARHNRQGAKKGVTLHHRKS